MLGLPENDSYRYRRMKELLIIFIKYPIWEYFCICFLRMALLTQSLILLVVVVIFQISADWIILVEEKWCVEKFSAIYREYMKSVRRYI